MAEMTDVVKRKEPEPETGAPATKPEAEASAGPEEKAATATPPATKSSSQKLEEVSDKPDAKRLKATPTDLKAVKKQVEYYLSDENLRYDKFFNEKIAGDKEGWLEMALVLSCNKMKAIRATKEDVLEALKDSKLEINKEGNAIRRQGNAPLPALETRPMHPKKSSLHAHDGGVVAAFSGIPEEQSWMQVKEKLKDKLPPKVQLWFVSEVNDKNQCIIAASPFDGDMQFFEELTIDLAGATIKSEVCQGELLQQSLKLIPKHVRDKRERESRKRQKERNRPILVGTQRFVNVPALRGRVKEILNSRSDGEQLKPDGSDFKLIKSLLEYHPKGIEKSKGLVGIKVAKSSKGESRCFYMIKDGGEEEDFSAKKCLDAVELNPPYVQIEPKDGKKDAAKAAGSAPAATAASEASSAPAAVEGGTATPEAKAEAEAAVGAHAAVGTEAEEPQAEAEPAGEAEAEVAVGAHAAVGTEAEEPQAEAAAA